VGNLPDNFFRGTLGSSLNPWLTEQLEAVCGRSARKNKLRVLEVAHFFRELLEWRGIIAQSLIAAWIFKMGSTGSIRDTRAEVIGDDP
jgi:hypothetical protein